jgi:uncharacterized protein
LGDRFDPFTDRTSRDIRNRLSQSLMYAIDAANSEFFESAIAELFDQNPVPSHESYLTDRLRRYREAFPEIQSRGLTDKFSHALAWISTLVF